MQVETSRVNSECRQNGGPRCVALFNISLYPLTLIIAYLKLRLSTSCPVAYRALPDNILGAIVQPFKRRITSPGRCRVDSCRLAPCSRQVLTFYKCLIAATGIEPAVLQRPIVDASCLSSDTLQIWQQRNSYVLYLLFSSLFEAAQLNARPLGGVIW